MHAPLCAHVLGELRILRGTEEAPLPASRKTRALLGFLALTGRPHRRERLCELFWDSPDDPRGALRWSLSKIRAVVNDVDHERVTADRERAALILQASETDLGAIRAALAPGAPVPGPEAMKTMARALAEPVLDGLDLPQLEAWGRWLAAEREDVAQLRLGLLARLAEHPGLDPNEALGFARTWLAEAPLAPLAAATTIRLLQRLGRPDEAEATRAAFRRAAVLGGIDPNALAEAETAPLDPTVATAPSEAPLRWMLRRQVIGFCEAPDGVRIAYARLGEGPPLVKAANWLNHLELDWGSPIWSRTFQALAERRCFIRYDERGNGLSDWDVAEISFEAFLRDLEAVVGALELGRFPLLGMSQGCAVSIAYAVRYPERVSALVLIGGYAAGWRIGAAPEERERREAVMTLTRLGWGSANPAYRRIFSHTFMPDATPEELVWFDEFQRRTTSPENAVRFQDAFGDIDVRGLLGQVRCPTLVLHARDDQRITLTQGREVAIGIPGARFVALESRSHILLGHEPAWDVCMAEIERFLTEQGL